MSEWRKCTTCKASIEFSKKYFICNVSTCQGKRAGLVFCSVSCWDAHVPTLRHKESWAIEQKAPSEKEWDEVQKGLREDTTYPKKAKTQVEPEPPKSNPFGSSGKTVVIRRRNS